MLLPKIIQKEFDNNKCTFINYLTLLHEGEIEVKKIILSIPIILFPYSVLAIMYCIFSGFLMETVFQNNVLYYIAVIMISGFISLLMSVSMTIVSYVEKWSASEMARINMVIKLAQIPAYVIIFVLGALFLLTIFTFGFTAVFIFVDIFSIFLSGLIGIVASRKNYTCGKLSTNEWIIHSILQFVFCADIISAIIIFRKSRLGNYEIN
jgi:hypothetical protein